MMAKMTEAVINDEQVNGYSAAYSLSSIPREMDKTMSAVKTFKLKCNKGRTEFSVSPVREKNKIELKH
ncbi:MAG TPA: hypothetical protein DE060_00130 [Lentisphaeria bacterium]|nr:hypothetical protein [Lentisphaeria bacterium]HCG47594.1 hypothetical protein [Lentisphaeria bacterium]